MSQTNPLSLSPLRASEEIVQTYLFYIGEKPWYSEVEGRAETWEELGSMYKRPGLQA